MNLREAFGITPGDVVALIGAGGKTSLLIGLGYELAEANWRVLATTTLGFGEDQLDLLPSALPITSSPAEISEALNEHKFVFLYDMIRDGHVYGSNPEFVQTLLDVVDSDVLLVEADNSNQLPLKAPYSDEPVIPSATSLVIPVASLDAVGKPLDSEHIYNAEAIIARYGFVEGARIRSAWLAQVLRDETLGLRGIPDGVRVIAFINQTPSSGYGRGRARLIAKLALRSERLNGVVLGEVRGVEPVHEIQRPVGAVVLAAGLSSRMGNHKILLPWTDERTIIEHIVFQLIRSRLDHIVVVSGHNADEVKRLMRPLDVKVVYNRSYKTGEMLSSLKAGLRAMPDYIAAAMVVLGDQPSLQPKVIYQLLNSYATSKRELVIPRFENQRGHPVLIGKRYWPELLALKRGGAPRDVINQYMDQVEFVNVSTDSILRDVDTPQDYARERSRAGF